jgi:Mrp family chromosome partitioning ATPase
MRELHSQLKELADVVIYDSPPCLATADAQVLAAESDGVLYVVQFGLARRSAVQHAGELLHQAHARIIGVVCNKVDIHSQRDDYYFGYYKYYDRYTANRMEQGQSADGNNLEQFLTTGQEPEGPGAEEPVEPSRLKLEG